MYLLQSIFNTTSGARLFVKLDVMIITYFSIKCIHRLKEYSLDYSNILCSINMEHCSFVETSYSSLIKQLSVRKFLSKKFVKKNMQLCIHVQISLFHCNLKHVAFTSIQLIHRLLMFHNNPPREKGRAS